MASLPLRAARFHAGVDLSTMWTVSTPSSSAYPREAQWLNPQERLFTETCWTAIEDAGYTPETLVAEEGPNKRRDVGVFVG